MSTTKSISFNFLSQIPSVLSGVIASIISSRLLGPEGKGVFGLYMQNIVFIQLFLGLGLNQAASYFSSKNKDAIAPLLKVGFVHSLITNLITTSLILTIVYLNADLSFNPKIEHQLMGYAFIVATIFLNQLSTLINAILLGIQQFRSVNQLTIFKSLFNAALYVSLFLIDDTRSDISTLLGVFFITIVGNIGQFIWLLLVLFKQKIDWSQKTSFALVRSFYSFSQHGYFSSLLNYVNYRIDIWILSIYASIDEIGIYLVAVNLSQMLWLISDAFANILRPKFTAKPLNNFRIGILLRFARAHSTIMILLSLIGAGLSYWLIPTVFGAAFAKTSLIFNLLLIGNLFACNAKVLTIIPFAHKHLKINLFATLIGAIITITLDLTLIPKYGILGATWASNFSYFGIFITLLILSFARAKYPLTIPLIITPKDLKFLIKK